MVEETPSKRITRGSIAKSQQQQQEIRSRKRNELSKTPLVLHVDDFVKKNKNGDESRKQKGKSTEVLILKKKKSKRLEKVKLNSNKINLIISKELRELSLFRRIHS